MNDKIKNIEEEIIETARKQLQKETEIRWIVLVLGSIFLGVCFYALSILIKKLDQLGLEQITAGFIAGFSLSFTCATFGILGGICIAKFIQGFAIDNQ